MTVEDPRLAAARALDRALDPAILDALCHPVRIALVRALIQTGEAEVGEIARGFPQDRSVISRHLAVLQRAGLAVSRRQGRHVLYDLDCPAFVAWLGTVHGAAARMTAIGCGAQPPEGDTDARSGRTAP